SFMGREATTGVVATARRGAQCGPPSGGHPMRLPASLLACLCACAAAPPAPRTPPAPPAPPAAAPIGYTDTPLLPDGYHVHDPARQPPPAVDTTGYDGDLLAPPPPGATVLFDGQDESAWLGADDQPARWSVVDGALEANGTGSIHTREAFGD